MSIIARLIFIFVWFRYGSTLDCDEFGHTNVECSYTIPEDNDYFYYVPDIGASINLHVTLKGAGGGTVGNTCTPGSGAKIIVSAVGMSPGDQAQITVGKKGLNAGEGIAIGGGGAAVGN